MTNFIIKLDNNEPCVHDCKQCVFETAFADPKYAELLDCIREIDRIRDTSGNKKYADNLISKHPQIQTILDKVNDASKRIETRHEARTLPEAIRYIRNNCHTNWNKNINIIIQEIESETICHTNQYNENCFHIPIDYDIKNTWNFGIPFLEYILQQKLIVIKDQACELMACAIIFQDLDMIDYLINAGADINYKASSDSQDDVLDGYDNYVDLATTQNFEVVKHILNKGCSYAASALEFYTDPKILDEIITFINFDNMTFGDKAAIVASCFYNLNALKALERVGVIISNEMMEIIVYDHDDLVNDSLEQDALEYMISRGLSVKYLKSMYGNALSEGKQGVIQLFEKNGIFEYYKPASFLKYVVTCDSKSLQYLLNQGVDCDEDQEEIRQVFIGCMCDIHHIRLLEPYIKDPDVYLFNAVFDKLNTQYWFTENKPVIDGVCYLIDHGATSYHKSLAFFAMRHLEILHAILERKPEIDIEFDTRETLSKSSTVYCLVQDLLPNFSLAEIIIFINKNEDFESTLELILERKANLDTSRLKLLFQKCMEVLTVSNFYLVSPAPVLIRKARFLANTGYLESGFVDIFIADAEKIQS